MTKSKKLVSRLMFVLLILTLISFCFVGITFARYTSSGTGTASVSVAKWNVADTFGETAVDFDQLSPSAVAYVSGTTRTKETAKTEIVTITNTGDVDATVTIDVSALADSLTATLNDGTTTVDKNSSNTDVFTGDTQSISFATLKKVFTIKLYNGDTELTVTANKATFDVAAKTGTVTLSAVVVWTSDIDGDTDATTGDLRDTYIGTNVQKVEYTVSYTAVQKTELPTA